MPRKEEVALAAERKAGRQKKLSAALALYAAGQSSTQAATAVGLCPATILKYAHIAGIAVRPPGPRPLPSPVPE